jgi:pyruvate dehydrogenase E2 component (dihydrolipoamide acetyltransferase)
VAFPYHLEETIMPVDVLVPPVGTNVETVTLSCWYRQAGESVQKGEPLFAVETDKATMDIEAPESGILRSVFGQPGEEVAALSRIAVIAAPGESEEWEIRRQGDKETGRQEEAADNQSKIRNPKSKIFISPRAKRLADERGLNWGELTGTGPEGAIVERDVRTALEQMPAAPRTAVDLRHVAGSGPAGKITRDDVARSLASSSADNEALETIPVSGVRAIIAQRMAAGSSEVAAVTLTTETDATALVEVRAELAAEGIAVSYNDLLLAILARALREFPRVNASLDGDTIRVWRRIDIGLAVDTERGLMVPVVRGADRLGLAGIARETSRLVAAAREGKILPEELRGGTFTLTNLGMFRIDAFTPIINLPECAVLGAGRIKKQPAVVDDQVVVRQRMWLSLTFDHRLVDGGPAARFLQRVSQLVEEPYLLLT